MPTPTYSTGAVIIGMARDETGVGSNPVGSAIKDTDMLRRLNDVEDEFVNAPFERGVLGWTFLETETIIETEAKTALNGDISSGASTITVDAASIWTDPEDLTIEAGYVRTGSRTYDYFTFEDVSTNDLEAVDGIQFDHTNDSPVSKIYKLPSDFGKPRAVFRQSDGYEYLFMDDDFRQVPRSNHYMIKVLTSGTNSFSASFMVFRHDIQGGIEFKINYQKQSVTITVDTTSVSGPDGTARRFYVEKMKEYIWNFLGEEEDAAIANARAHTALESTFSQWSTQHIEARNNLRITW